MYCMRARVRAKGQPWGVQAKRPFFSSSSFHPPPRSPNVNNHWHLVRSSSSSSILQTGPPPSPPSSLLTQITTIQPMQSFLVRPLYELAHFFIDCLWRIHFGGWLPICRNRIVGHHRQLVSFSPSLFFTWRHFLLLVALLLDPSPHSYSWPINAISDLPINDDTWEIDWNGKVQRCLMSDI